MARLGLSDMGSKLRKVVRLSPNEVPTLDGAGAGAGAGAGGAYLIIGLHYVDMRGEDGIRAQALTQAMTKMVSSTANSLMKETTSPARRGTKASTGAAFKLT